MQAQLDFFEFSEASIDQLKTRLVDRMSQQHNFLEMKIDNGLLNAKDFTIKQNPVIMKEVQHLVHIEMKKIEDNCEALTKKHLRQYGKD